MSAGEHTRDLSNKKQKKFSLGCDVDKEEIFNYPYLTDEDTIKFIKEHGHIMFIIRGPNSTLKATLSEMIMERYPTAQHFCADHYFSKTFSSPTRTKETIKLSHVYCMKKVEAACVKAESPIIVQNTHMRKMELQKYLELAAVYNYTVIMAITLYKFDVTPEALERINPDGLNAKYFRNRLRQWEDVPPLFTGWFLCPEDVSFILKSLKKTLSVLLNDAKFCHTFKSYDNDDIWNFFDGRRNLYCIAGYSLNKSLMKNYYLSELVQESYGKSFFLTIHGYLITTSEVMAIVYIPEEMLGLLLEERYDTVSELFNSLDINGIIAEYKATIPFDCNISAKTAEFEKGSEEEDINFKKCRFIHVAQRKFESFKIAEIKNKLFEKLNSLTDDIQYVELEDGIHVCRLPDDEWLVKLPQKMKVKTLFTGLYV